MEHIISKDEIDDPNSEKAQIIKARLLRHLNVFNDLRDELEQRFHDLLVKSLRERLTNEEQEEMDKIEGETTTPILAAERAKARALDEKIEQLTKLLEGGQLKL